MTAHAAPPAPASVAELPEWRLDDLYAGLDDPRIEEDLKAASARAAMNRPSRAAMRVLASAGCWTRGSACSSWR